MTHFFPTWRFGASTALSLLCALSSCSSNPVEDGQPGTPGESGATGTGAGAASADAWDAVLAQRQRDYGAALRIAALRLTGNLPTMSEIRTVAKGDEAAQKAAYEGLVRQYLDRPTFVRQALAFWRDTFRMGEGNLDTAPTFATQLTVENRSYLELLTATSGNCPTLNGTTFAAGNCNSGAPANVGVLTDPAAMRQFFGNMAFRRTRWVQETFACTKFPVEFRATPEDVGNSKGDLYGNPWPFTSISGKKNGVGTVDFHIVEGLLCANCHATMNHLAPLFANFDNQGRYQNQMSVPTPAAGTPMALRTDFIPDTEKTAWRFGKETANLTELGAAMSADPAIAECVVARMWNWALGKADIVDALQTVPAATVATQQAAFVQGGHKLKDLVFAVFTSDDFTKF